MSNQYEGHLNLVEQVAHCTTRIECKDCYGNSSTGTGFFFACYDQPDGTYLPVLVTNKHVVKGAEKGYFHMSHMKDGQPVVGSHSAIQITEFEQAWIDHPDPEVDLCFLSLNRILDNENKLGRQYFFITLDKSNFPGPEEVRNLCAYEEILMVGYPNGIWDDVNNMPIIRRGVTATHPKLDYRGKKEFLIDAACFPGSSGSPVFLYNDRPQIDSNGSFRVAETRFFLLGVLYAGPLALIVGDVETIEVVKNEKTVSFSRNPINLGYVIKHERLLEFDLVIEKMLSL